MGSSNQVFADNNGTRGLGEKCDKEGKNSCRKQDSLVCKGYRDNFLIGDRQGKCVKAIGKEGNTCVPNTEADCEAGLSCEGNTNFNSGGKCVKMSQLEEPCRGEGTDKKTGVHKKNWGQCDAGLLCIRESGIGNDAGICVTEDPNNPGQAGCVNTANSSCLAGFGNCCLDSGMSCVGAEVAGKANTPGKCIPFASEGEECLGDTEVNTGRYIPKCKPELDCEGASTTYDKPGKCVNNEVKNAPPPAPGPCPETMTDGKCPSFLTALGSVSTDPAKFIRALFGILLAMSGAIALLLIIRAGYKIMTSEGKPEAIQEGRERLISAIVGLLFLIFSFVFLQVIGVDILRIPEINPSPNSPNTSQPGVPNSQATCWKKLLKPGDTGECVELLQTIRGLPVDGTFGSETEEEVRKIQAEEGIFVDGRVGPCTWGVLNGNAIEDICSSPLNDAILRQYQTEKGLVIDGTLNSCTWEALSGLPIAESCKRK